MRRALMAALAVYLGAAAYLVLWPQPDAPADAIARIVDELQARDITSITASMVEFILNVVLFVPLTLLGMLIWRRTPALLWIVLGVGVSVLIEVVQKVALPDRDGTSTDLVANTLGALAGVAVGVVLRWIAVRLRRGRRTATATTGR